MKIIGWILLVMGGIYTLYATGVYLWYMWDFMGLVLGVFLGPVTLIVMPFYSILTWGDWTILGSSIIAIVGQTLLIKYSGDKKDE